MNTTRTASNRGAHASHVRSVTPAETTLLALIIVALFAGAWLSGGASGRVTETCSLRVEPGQTLWSIAREHPAAGRSTAETVQVLTEMNGLEGAALVAGEVLKVPENNASARGALALR